MTRSRVTRWITGLALACGVSVWHAESTRAAGQEREIIVVPLSGVINPAAASYIQRGVAEGVRRKAECVIIILDTPGGLMTSMDEIVKVYLNAKIPVITYIAPKGARAASAGVFIALASHVVAMAPGTSMGAAHPVDVQGAMASDKIVNAAAATIRAIARERNRDTDWAESTVRESKAITEQEGLTLGVVDIVAENVEELVQELDGRVVVIEKRRTTLHTKDATIVYLKMNTRERLLQTVADPQVAYVLFTLGMLGLIYEFSAPGFGFPGIVGSICMILALYAFNSISVSFAGLLLMIVAMLLFFFEVKAQTHGALSVGGIIAFVMGSLMLFNTHVPGFRLPLTLIVLTTGLIFLFFAFIVTKGLLAQKAPVVSGKEQLLGATGRTLSPLKPHGTVYAGGEEWSAVSDGGSIQKGQTVTVTGFDGVSLRVKPHGGDA